MCSECPIECNSVTYSIASHTSLIFDDDYNLYYDKAEVMIYYETHDYTLIQQVPQISPTNLFGDIGGILGLLIGVSILSIAEIMEFMIELIFAYIKHIYLKILDKKKGKRRKVQVKQINST